MDFDARQGEKLFFSSRPGLLGAPIKATSFIDAVGSFPGSNEEVALS
jgi:hypothetical protein